MDRINSNVVFSVSDRGVLREMGYSRLGGVIACSAGSGHTTPDGREIDDGELDPIPQFKATAKLGGFLEARFSESF